MACYKKNNFFLNVNFFTISKNVNLQLLPEPSSDHFVCLQCFLKGLKKIQSITTFTTVNSMENMGENTPF